MVTLIIGGSGSGKSAFAEALLSEIKDVKNKYYLATMQVCDDDGRRKVERHRRLRQGKGFLTLEQPRDIEQASEKMKTEDSAVLLECMSNLTANEMFGEKMLTPEETAEKVLAGMDVLRKKAKHFVIVTNNVFEDGICYEDGTTRYIKALAEINQRLTAKADSVIEIVVGLPIVIKGEK